MYMTHVVGKPPSSSQRLKQLCQYAIIASSPGDRGYCYAELAIFSPTVAVDIASRPLFITPTHGGMAGLSWHRRLD